MGFLKFFVSRFAANLTGAARAVHAANVAAPEAGREPMDKTSVSGHTTPFRGAFRRICR
jgi:hypothetical protein